MWRRWLGFRGMRIRGRGRESARPVEPAAMVGCPSGPLGHAPPGRHVQNRPAVGRRAEAVALEWCGRAAAVGAMSTEPRRFRSRPVEVDAVRLNGRDNQLEVAVWCGGSPAEDGGVRTGGRMLAKPGYWVVRGTDGEFAERYQLVGADR